VYSEATGEMSVFFYDDGEVRPGLSIIPEELAQASATIATAGPHACATCGHVEQAPARAALACPVCRADRWLPACTARRVA
jgi:predicted Zn-ribbon and HTH transcriptional regulator